MVCYWMSPRCLLHACLNMLEILAYVSQAVNWTITGLDLFACFLVRTNLFENTMFDDYLTMYTSKPDHINILMWAPYIPTSNKPFLYSNHKITYYAHPFVETWRRHAAKNTHTFTTCQSNLNEIDRAQSHALQSWWRHQMETFSALLPLCEGNPAVTSGTSGLPSQKNTPVTQCFVFFFYLPLTKRLSKRPRRR